MSPSQKVGDSVTAVVFPKKFSQIDINCKCKAFDTKTEGTVLGEWLAANNLSSLAKRLSNISFSSVEKIIYLNKTDADKLCAILDVKPPTKTKPINSVQELQRKSNINATSHSQLAKDMNSNQPDSVLT